MTNSLFKANPNSNRLFQQGLTLQFIYTGPSMHPTFCSGQLLHVRPGVEDIKPGDVLVYVDDRNGGCFVVHRVSRLTSAGFVLRGDDNLLDDGVALVPARIMGRVEMVSQGGNFRPVLGGRIGLLRAQIGWGARRVANGLRRLFWRPYALLRTSGLVALFWRPQITKVGVQSEQGLQVKYIYKKRTIAVWVPSHRRFDCRKPFDLVIPSPLQTDEQNPCT
jgi:hypothetical protein